MLYDVRYGDQFDAIWFDPAHWSAQAKARVTDGGRGASWFVDGDEPWVLRRYRRGGLAGRVLSDSYLWLGEDRARPIAEWRLLAWAHDAGLPVVRPVAALYERRGIVHRGALITARVAARSLATRMAVPGAPDLAQWRAAGAAVARCHAAGLDHADLNLHNLLLADDRRCWVIDLDRGARRAARGAWCDSNLARLRRSLDKLGAGWDDATRAAAWGALEDGYSSA
jgi:3-deoxy-D-manno-octulosonic acid kinase